MAANVRRNADKYARSWYAPVFGTRGSQVQILPSDQHHTKGADKSHLPANIDHLEPRRVHKLVHKRVLRMVTISQDAKGNFTARKRLPDDVREEYARRHGQRFEAKFFAAASTGAPEAKRLFREWETEVTARIDAIRAEHTGEGMALTLRQARALAGEWYVWFIARHPESDHRTWEALRDTVQDALKYAVGEVRWEESNPDDLWWNDAELRETVRPVLADVGETAQFLASKRLVLNNEARGCFLDWLYDDLAAALRRLTRLAKGDYSTDKYPERFPKFSGVDRGETPQQLFESWAAERKPARGTLESWQYVFAELTEHFKDRSAASISQDEAQDWINSLTDKRSASTVRNNWIAPCKAVFRWALKYKRVGRNPFADVTIEVPRKRVLRETKAFLTHEWRTILRASLAIKDVTAPDDAAKRWVPWLCAYTGARPAEITQLRASDVLERDGIHAIRITPDAGAVKRAASRLIIETVFSADLVKILLPIAARVMLGNHVAGNSLPMTTVLLSIRTIAVRVSLAALGPSPGLKGAHDRPRLDWLRRRTSARRMARRSGQNQRHSDVPFGFGNFVWISSI